MKIHNLGESNYKEVSKEDIELVVLPWGATEAHNYHLPYGTDNILAENVALRSSKKANKNGANSLVLPCVPFGVNTGQFDVDLCINMNPSTQLMVIKDILHVLHLQGINKFVIVNGHGGNIFKPIIREVAQSYPDIFVSSIDWWKVCDGNKYFDEPGDHAGELETSVVMHLRPDLVRPLEEAGDGSSNDFVLDGLKEGWATTQRRWSKTTSDTGVGNPKTSTPEKGEKFFEDVTDKIGKYLLDLSNVNPEDLYGYID